MKNLFSKHGRIAALVMICLSVAGCKEVLYSNLDEIQANEMVATLATVGISSSREADKKGIYTLSVDEQNVATAITILKNEGYPKEQFQSLGDVFSAEGIIGTPFEQQARFIHALNQELSRTLTSISGDREARVFGSVPTRTRYDRNPPRATASVTLHHEAGFSPSTNIAKIKQIVSFSVPNLTYDDVAVALFLARGPTVTETQTAMATSSGDLTAVSGKSQVNLNGFGLESSTFFTTTIGTKLKNLDLKIVFFAIAIMALILAAYTLWTRQVSNRGRKF